MTYRVLCDLTLAYLSSPISYTPPFTLEDNFLSFLCLDYVLTSYLLLPNPYVSGKPQP